MGKLFEKLLWESRLFVVIASVSSVVSGVLLIIIGSFDVVLAVKGFFLSIGSKDEFKAFHNEALAYIIGAVDFYLIATVLLIFGIGLYELFVSRIDEVEEDRKGTGILKIHSLDQLKEKLGKVILMVLVVIFFKHALRVQLEDVTSLLYFAGGTLLVSLALFFTNRPKPGKRSD